LSADVIYVGGGNTLHMMRVWRRLGVIKLLKTAYEKGTVLAGISAGAICWFESGHSDSMSFYNPQEWKYIKVRGLGLIKGIHCPHYDSTTLRVPRRKHFREMIRETGGIGIAIENNCAIVFIDGLFYKVIRSKSRARAYRVYKSGSKVVAEQLRTEKHPAPLKSLYDRPR
jgi:dipeptidase E